MSRFIVVTFNVIECIFASGLATQSTSTSPFLAQNDKVGPNWDWSHIDPTGTKNSDNLYAAGDLAAAMEVNPYLKVFSASGYYVF